MFDYEKLIKENFAICEDDFHNLYVRIEQSNAKQNKNFESWIYKYNFPRPDSYFVAECNKDGNAKLYLSVKGKIYTLGGKEKSVRELMDEASIFKKVMEENHLNFCPKYSQEFKNEITKADVGTVISLNTKRMIVCTGKNKDGVLFFKDCFSGKVENISINSFKNGLTFSVNTNDYNNIQDLFEYAYNRKTLTANIRIVTNSSHGAYTATDIEKTVKKNDTFILNVGPIRLKVCDFNGKKIWYDTDNQKLDRKTVELLFGWVQLSLPDIEIQRPCISFTSEVLQDSGFLQNVQNLIKAQLFKEIPKIAFKYSEENNILTYLNITGYEQQINKNFDTVTYAFQGFNNNQIIKTTYVFEENSKEYVPLKTEPVTIEEFISFCRKKYDETVLFLETEYTQLAKNYKDQFQDKRTVDVLTNILIDGHKQKNPPLVSPKDASKISDAVKILVEDSVSNTNKHQLNASDLLENFDLSDKE